MEIKQREGIYRIMQQKLAKRIQAVNLKNCILQRMLCFFSVVCMIIIFKEYQSLSKVDLQGYSSRQRIACSNHLVTSRKFVDKGFENIGAITLYGWDKDDFCLSTKQDLLWNPLFPRYPTHKQVVHQVEDLNTITNFAIRRFLFYLHAPIEGNYKFKISLQGGVIFNVQEVKSESILQVQTDHTEVHKNVISDFVHLRRNTLYFVDVIHWIKARGRLKLKWKTPDSSQFEPINGTYIFSLLKNQSRDEEMPKVPGNLEAYLVTRQRPDPKFEFYHRRQINLADSQTKVASCAYSPSYVVRHKRKRHTNLLRLIHEGKFFPDFTLLKHQEAVLLNQDIALQVAIEVFNLIHGSFCNLQKCKLDKVVFVEENDETKRGKRYFVELDITDLSDNQTLRFSDYFYKRDYQTSLCTPKEFRWQKNVTIYMVFTTSQNNKRWALIMLDEIANILKVTQDKQVHVVVVDYNTQGVDFHAECQRRNLSYTLIIIYGRFNKVKGFNKGASVIPDQESIILTMDLHLQLPLHFFDETRKSAILGKTVYAPIVTRMPCGIHLEYTEAGGSAWVLYGFGVLGMYKEDWDRIGGMNEVLFGEKWGKEDEEMIRRVIMKEYEVIRRRLSGYYHIYHAREGSFYGQI